MAGRNVSVAVGFGHRIAYTYAGDAPRILASNEKLLTSMAALDILGPAHRFSTVAASTRPIVGGVLHGDLWVVGGGDPELGDARLRALAAELHRRGLRRVTGAVEGDTSAFDRGWWASGWAPGIARLFVTRPTALAFEGNHVRGMPEQIAAGSLLGALEALGIQVERGAGAGAAPTGLSPLAAVRSAPLATLLERQNHDSINFYAEMLAKALGAAASGAPGSTASGAHSIERWVAAHGVQARILDGSGLSHLDRTSASGVVTLLLEARHEPWFTPFLASLPVPGQGTLEHRLAGVPVRAKTGSLFVTPASTLSGYVRDAAGRTVAFSVLTRGMGPGAAIPIEDAVVRLLAGARVG